MVLSDSCGRAYEKAGALCLGENKANWPCRADGGPCPPGEVATARSAKQSQSGGGGGKAAEEPLCETKPILCKTRARRPRQEPGRTRETKPIPGSRMKSRIAHTKQGHTPHDRPSGFALPFRTKRAIMPLTEAKRSAIGGPYGSQDIRAE